VEENIKNDLREIDFLGVDWINLVQRETGGGLL
jgi:hypothetical protein